MGTHPPEGVGNFGVAFAGVFDPIWRPNDTSF